MNLKEIREIINLMNDNDLTEIEVERDGSKIKIKKANGDFMATAANQPVYHLPASVEAPAQAESSGEATSGDNENKTVIKSPMVGTFYRAPSPESPVFVEVGQIVEVGQVVCIVEAMKLMNEIKSEVRGKVIEISVDNAQPVEFGQTLFVIDPQ